MATASKSQSTKRSEAPNKIKIQMNGSSAKVIHEDDDSEDASSDSSSPDSPKATPKSVKEKESTKDDQLKKKKEAPIRVDTSVLENVTCTACGRQLNPYKNNSVQKHPELKVIICKKCDKFLSSGQIAKDKDGTDEQCRWCGEGGRLIVCDHCSCAFCKACVMRNFNRSEFNNINDQESWKCYLCDKSQLQGLKDYYRNVRDAMKALQAKKKNKEQAMLAKEAATGNGRSSSGKASQISNRKGAQAAKSLCVGSSTSNNSGSCSEGVALSMQDLEVEYAQVEVIMDKLSTATNTFKEMLRALRSQFHSTSPRRPDEAPPMFNFSLGNSLDLESKKQRCAKALNMGLQTYFQSLRKILHPEDNQPNASSQTSKVTSNTASSCTSNNSSTRNRSITSQAEGDVLVLDNESSEEDVSSKRGKVSSSNSKGNINKSGNKEKDLSSKNNRNESESLKGKLSVSSLFSKSKSTPVKNNDAKSSFKSCAVAVESDNIEEFESVTPPSENQIEDDVPVKDTSDKHKSTRKKHGGDDNEDSDGEGDKSAKDNSSIKDTTVTENPEETDIVDENVAAKLSMIQQLADEISDSEDNNDEHVGSDENAWEDIEDSAEDEGGDSATKRKGKSFERDDKSASLSPSKDAKKHTKEKDSCENSETSIKGKTNVGGEKQKKQKSLGESKDNSDKNDDSSSSDPLDSDEDDGGSRKTKKRKVTAKDSVKDKPAEKDSVKDKSADKDSVKDKSAEKVAQSTRGQPSRNNAKKTNGFSAQPKGKANSNKKVEKSKAKGEDEEDEMDKEIEKLSKLPTVQKKKTKKDQKEEEEAENTETKKGTRQSKRVAKTKENLDLDDLSSDEEAKKESEEEEEEEDMDSDLEPPVTFAQNNNEDVEDDEDNLLAKNQLLEEEDDLEEDEEGNESSDEEDDDVPSKTSKSKKTKSKKEDDEEEEEENGEKGDENSDSDENIGRKKRMRSKLLDSKLTDSDSDIGVSKKKKIKEEGEDSFKEDSQSSSGSSLDSDSDEKEESSDEGDEDEDDEEKGAKKKRKKKGKKRRKRKAKKGGSNEEEDEEEDEEGKGKKGKKRKRIKKMSDSSDDGNDDDDDDKGGFGKRKKIRKVMSNKKLEDTTKAAAKAEEKRRKRIAAKQREFNIETVTDENNPMNAPMTTKLILEPGKEEGDDPIVQVNKKLIRKLKPHQVEAVQFMWDCLYESVKRSKKEEGAGCILAHCMGLGKTLSVISFVHTVLTHQKIMNQRTCLVVCPLNTVLNWRNEWQMWFDKRDRLEVWELASCKQNVARADVLREWQESGGIMIIGYEMYRNLTTGARIKNKKQKKAFHETLVDPGPDLCVCDEGHILKNENSSLSKSMNTMKTRRRIVLTGTPLQNNLNEYHCMVTFVKPNLLGTRKEFNNRFISPIQNGQCTDSTPRDVRIMKARAHVLHEMLAGCVQRRDYSALTKFLPPKQEYVISVRLSDVQIELYQKYLELTGQGVDGVFNNKGARLFKDYQNLMKIWTHPWVLKLAEIRDELKMKYDDDEDSFIDDDSDEERSESTTSSDSEEKIISDSGDDEGSTKGPHGKKGTKRTRAKARRQAGEDSDPEEVIAEWKSKMRGEKDSDLVKSEPADNRVSSQWWAQYVTEEDKTKVELGNKLYLLFEILRMCEEIGDKVLIFSQSILSLNIIESFLETIDSKFQEDIEKKEVEEEKEEEEKEKEKPADEESEAFGKCWTKHLDYYRMDGSTSAQNRQLWAESFNDMDNYRARLFLISTKAGGLGINLVAANRVIIFDASWNPSHDVQSIFRVYRFGQTKPCYIYRFLAQGTMEEKIYERQVTKLSLSQRVVDEHQIERHFSANDLRELYNFKPEKWEEDGEHATLALPKDPLLAEILKTHRKCVVSFHEHDSLLENQIEQTLSEEEKKAAWEEYENEKKGIIVRGPGMESMRGASWPMMAAAQILSKEQIAATVHALRQQLPDLPEDVFHMHVQQALRRQVQMKQDEMRRMEMMRMQELTYLNMMQQQQELGGMSGLGAMQNMAPWMQIQQLRAMQNHMMRGNRNHMMGGMTSSQLSNRPDEAINLDESPSKS